jgi:hypothetical protein
MRFEVLYSNGVQHEVELQGTLAYVGRDPSCELVLNDAKCSRKHAVLEAGPDGMAIRDNGSANGVFVNGRKVDRAALKDGDIIRLGETVLKVLPESITSTIMMEADEIDYEATEPIARPEDITAAEPETIDERELELDPEPPRAAPPTPKTQPPPRPPQTRPARPSSPSIPTRRPAAPPVVPVAEPPRPLTLTVLAILWLIAGAVYGSAGLGFALFGGLSGTRAALSGIAGVAMALLSGLMGFGLWARSSWARMLQLVLSGIGALICPITLPSLAVMAYMLRPEVRAHFEADKSGVESGGSADLAFTLAIVGSLLLGIVLTAGGLYFGWDYVSKRL